MINFSIVIPHYNIPHLLVRCLRSIPIRQDIQVIVVDDCSPDAETYKNKYPEFSRPNVELYSTVHGGSAGRARNVGLEQAQGRWISFLDADDFLPEDILQIMDLVKQKNVDLFFTEYQSVMSEDVSKPSRRDSYYHQFLDEFLTTGDDSRLRYMFDPMWGKWVSLDFVNRNKLRFDETRWGNDCYFSIVAGVKAQTIAVSSRVGYIVTERGGSLSHCYCGTMEEMIVRAQIALRIHQLFVDNQISHRFSPIKRTIGVMRYKFNYVERIMIAFRFWRSPMFFLKILMAVRPLGFK